VNIIKRVLLPTILLGGGLWIGSIVTSSADGLVDPNQPGSVEDPIVTKSYVDEHVRLQVKNELSKQTLTEDKIRQLMEQIKKEQASTSITVLSLNAGQTLYAGAGTEFIVRTGKAVAYSTDGNGIPDLTGGKDIPNGAPVALNHLLLFPREGRGIKLDPKSTATVIVMVRGNYLHLNADGSKVTP
jgi:hypothetical protein